jgi:hypothetical protein
MINMNKVLFIFAVMILMSGCAAGNRIDYRQAVPMVNVSTANEVAVLVIDERPYITSRNKSANYLGNSRALYYNPFKVTTVSGNSLAVDLQVAIIDGLKRNGINARHQTATDAVSEIVEQRLLLVTIREWKVDAYMRVRFDYDITATVQDEKSNVIGASQTKGSGPITNFLTAGGDVLRAVIDDELVKLALTGQTSQVSLEYKPTLRLKQSGSAYDECMARVMRISDSTLRLRAMTACDDAL